MPFLFVIGSDQSLFYDEFVYGAVHLFFEQVPDLSSIARQLSQRFGCKKVAITLRGSISASENTWAGMLYDAKTDKAVLSRSYHILIVDRVGGGDSFGGGLVYALSQGYSDQDAINFAVAASCLKHTIEHDFNQVKVEEVLALMNGSGNRVNAKNGLIKKSCTYRRNDDYENYGSQYIFCPPPVGLC